MAKCPKCNKDTWTKFQWADNSDIIGMVCMDAGCFTVFDMVDNADDAEEGKGKKIGHKKNKYAKLGEKIQTWHIKEKDKKEPKEEKIKKGGQE